MPPTSPILNFAAGLRPSPPRTPTAPHAPLFLPRISTGPGPGPGPGPGGLTPPGPRATVSRSPEVILLGNEPLSHTSSVRPEDLSPCSPSSSIAEISEPDESESSSSESGQDSPVSPSALDPEQDIRPISPILSTSQSDFVIEELSDFDEDDMQGRDDIIRPHTIEYAESERSRSRTRLTPDDPHMINDLRNLKCRSPDPNNSSSSDDSDLDIHETILRQNRAAERKQRMSHSSIGTKRTVSERGSDSDHEDVRQYAGLEQPVQSPKRLKRRNPGDRRSLNFSDPPPRIEEVVEPEELEEALARELPFYEYTSMEVDSPRSP